MKENFCGGICTTSRLESKHRILKKYLNSSKRLTELFNVFRELESKEISSFKNEIEKMKKAARNKLAKSNFIKHFQSTYTKYIIMRLEDNLVESTNYKIEKIRKGLW